MNSGELTSITLILEASVARILKIRENAISSLLTNEGMKRQIREKCSQSPTKVYQRSAKLAKTQ
jgi:hypothetical protein